jgi:hypothetical protein
LRSWWTLWTLRSTTEGDDSLHLTAAVGNVANAVYWAVGGQELEPSLPISLRNRATFPEKGCERVGCLALHLDGCVLDPGARHDKRFRMQRIQEQQR